MATLADGQTRVVDESWHPRCPPPTGLVAPVRRAGPGGAGPTPGVPWIYAPDGAGMSDQLEELGIITSGPRPTELPGEDVPGGAD